MGLLDKLRGKKDDKDEKDEKDEPKAGMQEAPGGGELIVDPAYSGEYLPKEGVGGSPQGNAEEDDSGGSEGAVR